MENKNQSTSVYPSVWFVYLFKDWGVAQWSWLAFRQFNIIYYGNSYIASYQAVLDEKNKTSTSSIYPCTLIFLEVDLKASAFQISTPVRLCMQDYYLIEKIFPIYNQSSKSILLWKLLCATQYIQ